MTDRELEQRLRAWYAAQIPASETAPHDLRASLTAIPATAPAPLRSLVGGRRFGLLAVAAVLLVGGALAGGSGLLRQTAVVPPTPSEELFATPVPSTSKAPAETPSPTASPKQWITGQQLADLLSSENGYRWVSVDRGDGRTALQLDQPRADRISIEISPPFDDRATVSVGIALESGGETLGSDVDRVAQALAPDIATWIQDAFNQAVAKPGGGSAATDTANGGSVGVIVVDEIVLEDWAHVWFSPDPLPPVRTEPIAPGSVVYEDSGLIRVANADGTDAGTLLGGAHDPRVPGAPGVARVIGWSPDGSRLFYDAGGTVMSTDAMGSEPTLIGRAFRPSICAKLSGAAQQAACEAEVDRAGIPELCPLVTVTDTCEANMDEILISPDGTRLAYPIGDDSGVGVDKMGFLDLATGQVTRVAFDSETGPGEPACEGLYGGGPRQWSPDGRRFAFGDTVGPRVDGWCQGAVFTIKVDGTDLRRITPPSVHAMDPRWSPDGSTIVFASATPRSAWDGNTDATRIPVDTDIYSVRPDGSGLTALTSDGASRMPYWTRDGRIVLVRDGELWVMDADGRHATRLDTTIAAQTAAGCTVCPYPDAQGQYYPSGRYGPLLRHWRPGKP